MVVVVTLDVDGAPDEGRSAGWLTGAPDDDFNCCGVECFEVAVDAFKYRDCLVGEAGAANNGDSGFEKDAALEEAYCAWLGRSEGDDI